MSGCYTLCWQRLGQQVLRCELDRQPCARAARCCVTVSSTGDILRRPIASHSLQSFCLPQRWQLLNHSVLPSKPQAGYLSTNWLTCEGQCT